MVCDDFSFVRKSWGEVRSVDVELKDAPVFFVGCLFCFDTCEMFCLKGSEFARETFGFFENSCDIFILFKEFSCFEFFRYPECLSWEF